MTTSNIDIDKAGWSFDNTYSKLPDDFLVKQAPIPVKSPELIIINKDLSKDLDLDFTNICLLYTSPSPRDRTRSRMPSSA